MFTGNNEHKQSFKYAQTAGNLAENAQDLRNDKDADENVKGNINKGNQREI